MRADDGDLDGVGSCPNRRGCHGGMRQAGRAERQPGGGMERLSDAGEHGIVPGRGDQRHSRRRAVGRQAGGDGERAEIEQVDEIGIAPEQRIGADGVGGHLG